MPLILLASEVFSNQNIPDSNETNEGNYNGVAQSCLGFIHPVNLVIIVGWLAA